MAVEEDGRRRRTQPSARRASSATGMVVEEDGRRRRTRAASEE
jgi:hypothetical protein